MRIYNWMRVGAISALLSITALADHGGSKNNNGNEGGNDSFDSGVVGSVPSTTIGGVASGGAPWTVARGRAFVSSTGKLEVEVHGLLLTTGAPANLVGTVGPVMMVAASLVCGGSGGAVAASTDGVPLSPAGDAKIEVTVTVPPTCMAPVILVRVFNNAAAIGSQLGPFIALTGLNMSTAKHDDDGGGDNE
jgi:hypothetical protein